MSLYERICSSLIGSPLQRPAEGIRWYTKLPSRLRYPEMKEIYLEHGRTDEVLHKAIVNGMNCIDVGCHLGSMLQKMIELSPTGKHLAIEPVPYKAEWLRKKYPNIEIKQTALSDRPGEAEFFINSRQSGFSGLRVHGSSAHLTKLKVELNRLDDLVPRDRRIGFMKVDVEGAELDVFRGASRILAESRPTVLFECTNSGLTSFGYSAAQIFKILVENSGYQIFLFKDWLSHGLPLDLARFEASMIYPFQAFNYLAVPKES